MINTTRGVWLVLVLFVFGVPTYGFDIAPVGSELQLHASGVQPDVAMDSSGNFVVVWSGVFAQRFTSDGSSIGPEFQVSVLEGSTPKVAMAPNGNFVVVWRGIHPDGIHFIVLAMRFDSAGNELPPPAGVQGGGQGNEFQVNTFLSFANRPSVAMEPNGDFIVAWESDEQDGSEYGIFARRFSGDGTSLGGEFQVNTITDGQQETARVAVDANGNFVVVWLDDRSDRIPSVSAIAGRRFFNDGTPNGSQFQVNTFGQGEDGPAVGMDANGNFVVVRLNTEGPVNGIFARRFLNDGTAGPEFQVSSFPYDQGEHDGEAIAMDAGGNFVISWHSREQDGNDLGVFAKGFDAAGNEVTPTFPQGGGVGNEFQVNSSTGGFQQNSAVAMNANGNILIAWEGSTAISSGTFAQRYQMQMAVNTPIGNQVAVDFPAAGVSIKFAEVTVAGVTTVTRQAVDTPIPGFRVADCNSEQFFVVTTTAAFTTAQVTVAYDPSCFTEPPPLAVQEQALELLHFDGTSPDPDVVTQSRNPGANTITSVPLTAFSPFVIAWPVLEAEVRIEPIVLSARSAERSNGLVAVFVEGVDGASVFQILPETVRLLGAMPVLHEFAGRGKTGGRLVLHLRCADLDLSQVSPGSLQPVEVTGILDDGRRFRGTAAIFVK